jgi:phage terminase Nu1 subunit (DNA packaging protein)
MSQLELTKAQLVDRFGESAKQVERYVAEGMPCTGTGVVRRFPWPEVRNWRDSRVERMAWEAAEKKWKPAGDDEVKLARDQRTIAENKMIQIDLAEREGRVITTAHHEAVCSELGERLRAVLINLPGNYSLDLERLGVPVEKAQEVLERIAADVTSKLRDAAEEMEDDDSDRARAA